MASTANVLRPAATGELSDIISAAAASGEKLQITGGGSKARVGAPTEATLLDMTGFAGVIDYDPAELVLTVGVGTRLSEVLALVGEHDQMLAFDPFDHATVLGGDPGQATIGGVVAAGVAGPLRLSQGGARDHLLGFKAVSGRGEAFVAGAKVVKNVTGYDLSKLMAGSWGRLAAMTEITLKVLPRAKARTTKLIAGLSADQAVQVMSKALGSQAEVWAAAYLPDYEGRSVTALNVQGFETSVEARSRMLDAQFDTSDGIPNLSGSDCAAFWSDIATLKSLPRDRPLWRLVLAPSRAPALMNDIDGRWLLDWAGGLVWVATDMDADALRSVAAAAGGHAALVRADAVMRTRTTAFHPPSAGVAGLEARVRRAFDPAGVFETGRF